MAKRAVKAKVDADPKGLCFCIMPFGGYFDQYWSEIYEPAIQDAELEPRRGDSIFSQVQIIDRIWTWTQDSKVLLADLSTANPNVFYELGLAHSLPRPVVLVSDDIATVPFDLRHLQVVLYDKNRPHWGATLREDVTRTLKIALNQPNNWIPPTYLREKPASEVGEVSVIEKLEQRIRLLEADRRDDRGIGQFGVGKSHTAQKVYEIMMSDGRRMAANFLSQGMRPTDVLEELIRRGGYSTSQAEEILAAYGFHTSMRESPLTKVQSD